MYFDFSKIDVEDFLNDLGLNKVSRKGDQVWFSCPLSGHMGIDKTPSASMEIGTTRMHCFGCGFSGNAVSFLAEHEGVSPLKARKWIRERFEMGFFEPKETFSSEINKKLDRITRRAAVGQSTPLHHTLLDEREVTKRNVDWYKLFDLWQGKMEDAYPLAYMLDRGFHPKTLTEWAIGWDMISQRISIPVHDEYGNLVGFKARAVDDNPQRYKVLGGAEYGFETYGVSKYLFGLDKAKEYIEVEGCMIVREGELNTIALHQAGFKNAVGSGKILSDTQINLIKKYAKSVIFSYDEYGDTLNAAEALELSIPVKICDTYKRDPSDMHADEIKEMITNARPSILV